MDPIADAEADWLAANEAHLRRAVDRLKALLRGEAVAVAAADDDVAAARPFPIDHLAAAFELTGFERDLLLLCAAVELDPEVANACAHASAGSGRPFASLALAATLLPHAHWSAIGPQSPLRRWRLVVPAEGQPMAQASLRIDETILHYLLAAGGLDPRLAAVVVPLPRQDAERLAPTHAECARRIAAAWRAANGRRATLVQVTGDPAAARRIVAAAAGLIGMHAAVIAADHVPPAGDALETLVQLWTREICLSGFGVLAVEHDERGDAEEASGGPSAVTRLLGRLPGPTVLCEREPSRLALHPAASIRIHPLSPAEQSGAWRTAFAEAMGADVTEEMAASVERIVERIPQHFSLDRDAIDAVAAAAVARGAAADALPGIAWELARVAVRARVDGLAQRIDSNAGWDDLILPESELATLRAIAAQVRQRATVYEHWGFARRGQRGLGIGALFSGPSGTGKTMAAEVLANELGLDLYRIDLAAVVSKYIGETEKNLRRVFDVAERSGSLLLFDEADALFGRRSEVKDSHDRYANIEVSYLLQRMEEYSGLAVLTSNLKASLDTAFLRRLRFVVSFPFPDAAERRRIWMRVFPPQTPTRGIDHDRLAQLRVTGGTIRSIAINAAFLAADAGRPVGMDQLRAAALTEYAKLERQATAAELAAWD